MLRKIKKSVYVLFGLGTVFGILLWGGFHTVLEQTNTLEFCISCHEMEQSVYQEYLQSSHYKNASGVRAICSDCHVPKAWLPKVIREIKASNELYHKILGTIDTQDKFEAKRLELAENVWASMLETDSRECRNCHSYDSMDFHKQDRRSQEKMQKVVDEKTGETCIECHKGLVHKLPDDYERDD